MLAFLDVDLGLRKPVARLRWRSNVLSCGYLEHRNNRRSMPRDARRRGAPDPPPDRCHRPSLPIRFESGQHHVAIHSVCQHRSPDSAAVDKAVAPSYIQRRCFSASNRGLTADAGRRHVSVSGLSSRGSDQHPTPAGFALSHANGGREDLEPRWQARSKTTCFDLSTRSPSTRASQNAGCAT